MAISAPFTIFFPCMNFASWMEIKFQAGLNPVKAAPSHFGLNHPKIAESCPMSI
jgi:hypothetical protein